MASAVSGACDLRTPLVLPHRSVWRSGSLQEVDMKYVISLLFAASCGGSTPVDPGTVDAPAGTSSL